MTITKPLTPWLELREIRQKSGWELTQLAEASGVSRESLRLYELGERRPRPSTISKLARTMKVPYSVLEPSPRDGDDQAITAVSALEDPPDGDPA